MEQVLSLVLGWFLGLLSVPITDLLQRRRTKQELRVAMSADLGGLAYRLAHVVYMTEQRTGTLDRPVLQWVLEQLDRNERHESPTKLGEGIRGLLGFSDDQLRAALAAKRMETLGTGMAVKEYGLRFLETHLAELRLYGVATQRRVLEVVNQLNLYNAQVADAREWLRMTFDQALNEANRAAVERNLTQTYQNLGERARIIVNEVGEAQRALDSDA